MIITLIFVLILIAILGAYVCAPLLADSAETIPNDGFENEDELRKLIQFRDQLLAKLTGKSTVSALPDAVQSLNEEQATSALLRVCSILKHAGMPYLPHKLGVWIIAALAAAAALGAFAPNSAAYAQAPDQAAPQSSMPPLLQNEDGTQFPQINQFILSPDEGRMRVFYLSLFYTEKPEAVKIRIPSPQGAEEFDFSSMNQATLSPNRAGEPPVLEFTSQAGVNQLRGVFFLPAFSGEAVWKSEFFKELPGVVLFILPEYHSVETKLLGEVFAGLNVWPPRINHVPDGFEFKRVKEEPNKRDPNFTRMKNPPEQHSFHYIRRGDESSPYPELKVSGLVANRLPGHLIVVTFGMLLVGIALFTLGRKKKKV